MTSPPITSFRILVVDEIESIHHLVRDVLRAYEPIVHIDCAFGVQEADELLGRTLYDLALVEMYEHQTGAAMGTEIYRRIDKANVSTRVIFMSRYDLAYGAQKLLQLTSSPSAWRLAGFLDKRDQFVSTLDHEVGRRIETFRKTEASINGLDSVVKSIRKKRNRYRSTAGDILLRSDSNEIAAEVDRLIRKLYVELPGNADRNSHINVSLEGVNRRGLSAAVVVIGTIEVKFPHMDHSVGHHKTVLKIGPKNEIFEEAARFSEYVRYGVQMDHRMELFSVAGADALGGLVYSFAGGLYNNDLLSLDQVLVEDLSRGDVSLSTTAIESLFASRHWYSVQTAKQDVSAYFSQNYRTDLARSHHRGWTYLVELGGKNIGGPRVERRRREKYIPQAHI